VQTSPAKGAAEQFLTGSVFGFAAGELDTQGKSDRAASLQQAVAGNRLTRDERVQAGAKKLICLGEKPNRNLPGIGVGIHALTSWL
jgi:hypothetical protein